MSKGAGEAFLGRRLLFLLRVLILKDGRRVLQAPMLHRLTESLIYGLIRQLVMLLGPQLAFPEEMVGFRERLPRVVPRLNLQTAIARGLHSPGAHPNLFHKASNAAHHRPSIEPVWLE